MTQSARILLVDDHPISIQVAEAFLERAGYAVIRAEDGERALALAQSTAPAAILMDLNMPGMDGLEVTRRLKADPATRAIPIIALTAYAMRGDEERARAAGCDDYVPKPIDRQRLLATIARHVPGGS